MPLRARHRTPGPMALVCGLLACSVGGVALGYAAAALVACLP